MRLIRDGRAPLTSSDTQSRELSGIRTNGLAPLHAVSDVTDGHELNVSRAAPVAGGRSAEESLRHIKEQFVQHKPGHKQLYTHVTVAVDIAHMQEVLVGVMDKIVDINLRRTQLH